MKWKYTSSINWLPVKMNIKYYLQCKLFSLTNTDYGPLTTESQFLVDSSRRSTISVAPCCSEPHRSYKTCIECRPECSTDPLIKNTSVYAEYIILIRNTFLISVENSIDIYTIQLKILFHNIIQNLSFFKIHINSSVKIHPMIHVLKFISSWFFF